MMTVAPTVDALDLTIDPSLPIAAHEAEIAGLLLTHQVVIVAGETGSGKTTQLPKICLKLGREHIGHTQPRRIAARTVATRIAQEIGTPLGDAVGYQVRFTSHTSAQTQLKVMTDGILLAEIAHDRMLKRYDTLIIDEAHERSLNIDFLLGYLKQLLPSRADLKVIITSATIDTARFSEHFDGAPIVEVSGRTYPVEVRYRPLTSDDVTDGIVTALKELPRTGDTLVFLSGERDIKDAAKAIADARLGVEILPLYARLTMEEQARVFAPHTGQRVVLATNVAETSLTVPGIRYVVDPGLARISRYSARTKVQRLPIEEISQASANQRAGRCGRVAPGVCIRLYSEEDFLGREMYTQPEILRTNLASVILAMANARLGDIEDFPFVEAPDRSQIADGMRLLEELGAITRGPSRHGGKGGARGEKNPDDPTPRRGSGDGSDRATGNTIHLTSIGRRLAGLPIDPRLGRILLEAARLGCLKDAIVLVAGLTVQDVRERPADHQQEADALHARFAHPESESAELSIADKSQSTHGPGSSVLGSHGPGFPVSGSGVGRAPARITPHTGWKSRPAKGDSAASGSSSPVAPGGDFAAMLNLWAYLRDKRKELGSSQFRRLCHQEYINYLRVREWQDLVGQLREICKDLKVHETRPDNGDAVGRTDMNALLTACLSGLLSHIGALEVSETTQKRRGPREYAGTRGSRFALWPGSALAHTPPALVMAVELIETTRLWAHTVAAISVEQVEQVGGHLLTRTYSQPYFSMSSGSVLAHEKVSLLGVVLAADRTVGYAQANPGAARAIFIQSGLVEDRLEPRAGSAYARVRAHNQKLRKAIDDMEIRTRRRDLLVTDMELASFFEARLPDWVVSGQTLDAWLRVDKNHVAMLMLTEDDVLVGDAGKAADYPDVYTVGGSALRLDYHFAPGDVRDGVTVAVPLSSLASLDSAPFTWGVPGTRQELATELIRGLPKNQRTNFVPAPDWAAKALEWLSHNGEDHTKPMTQELTRALRALTGVTPTDWNPDALPPHLRMGFSVKSPKGEKYSRDLPALQSALGAQVRAKLTTSSPRPKTSGLTWVFGTLPASLILREHGIDVTGYPALKDEATTVSEALVPLLPEAQAAHHKGLTRLALAVLPDPGRWIVSHLSNDEKLALASSPYASVPALMADARWAGVHGLIGKREPWGVRDAEAFESLVATIRPDQVDQTYALVKVASESLVILARIEATLERLPKSEMTSDVRAQVRDLVFDGFLHVIDSAWVTRVPTWLNGVEVRLETAPSNLVRDKTRMDELDIVLNAYADAARTHPARKADLARIGYLVEELRISLFAQPLRTREPVSVKRLLKVIADVK
ncbi:MAG: DUF3418 domain-containing protein [Propionibacteriaceae bacterium]|jgi:ATP-dependent helicase HrpA|nr:DUF3418 domain-containing protein [Propionibacteriaceae bacterium]